MIQLDPAAKISTLGGMKPATTSMAGKLRQIRRNQPRVTLEEDARQRQAMKNPLAHAKPAPKLKKAA